MFENTAPAPDGTRFAGRAAVLKFWQGWFANNPDGRFEVEEEFAAGDRYVVRRVYRKTRDGKPWHLRGIDVFHVRDGRVSEKLAYIKRVTGRLAGDLVATRPRSTFDVLIVGRPWLPRAMLRAQLIEEDFDVVAVETWPAATSLMLAHGLPLAAVLMLDETPGAEVEALLREGSILLPVDRVVVLTSASVWPSEDVRRFGYRHVLVRPYSVGDVAAVVGRVAR